jgi:hypothetical protein
MNRAIATIHRLEKEQAFTIKQHTKFRCPKPKYKPDKIKSGIEIHFKVPINWRNKLQEKANKNTKGNLSEYLRILVQKDIKYKKGDLT